MSAPPHSAQPETLLRINNLRLCLIIALLILLVFAYANLNLPLPYIALSCFLALYTSVAAFVFILYTYKRWYRTPGPHELFIQLLVDIAFLGGMLYVSAGANNPLITLLLLPLTISAALLSFQLTLWIAGSVIGLYTTLLFYFIPVGVITPHLHHDMQQPATFFQLHIAGMWLTFVFSAALITVFVARLALNLREREAELSKAREKILRHEQLVAIGTQAAHIVHELATPLNSLTLLFEEMKHTQINNDDLQQDINLIDTQLLHCKAILQQLSLTAEKSQHDQNQRIPLDGYIQTLLDHWHHLKPHTQADIHATNKSMQAPQVQTSTNLTHSIINLINNAADASPSKISLNIDWSTTHWTLAIRDYGTGIDEEILTKLGEPFTSTKGDGRGLGIFLAHASIEHMGGDVVCRTNFDDQEGTLITITLPL